MSSSIKFLLTIITSMLVFITATGESYTVGDSEGWSVYTDYPSWVKGKTFHVGDHLVFNYKEGFHSVVHVNEAAYANCVKEPNLGEFASGNDTMTLVTAGNMWYICGVGDHCENGQKMSIEVLP